MKYLKASFVLIPVALYLACSQTGKLEERLNDKRVVLQLGENKLTMADVEKKFKGVQFRTPQDEFERKRGFVEQSLERFLLIDGAREAGFTFEPDSTIIKRYLLKNLYNREIMDKINVTKSAINDFFEKYGGEVQAGHILMADSAQAESVYIQLKNGADFGEMAKKYSLDTYTAEKGGTLGYAPYGKFEDAFQDAAFSMKIGEISRPVHTRYGWHIIKVFDRIKTTRDDLEKDSSKYWDSTHQYLEKKTVAKFVDKVKADNHYQIVQPTVQLLVQKADSAKAAGGKPLGLPSSAYLDSTLFSDNERSLFLVKYEGGGVSVGDYLDLMRGYRPEKAPELRDSDILDKILEGMAMPKLLEQLAKETGIEKSDAYLGDIEYYKGNFLAQKMRDKINSSVKDMTEDDVAKYYDEHRDQFYLPDQIRASAIAVKTQKEADDLLARAKSGADFVQLAKTYSVDKKTGVEGGDLNYFTVARNAEIYKAAENMKIGDLGGPVQMTGNWWIFKLTGRITKQPKSIDQASPDIRSRLAGEWRNQAYSDWIAAQKQKAQYSMNMDLIKNNLVTGTLSQPEKPKG